MTVLLDASFPRAVDLLEAAPGALLEAWVFEDAATRRQAEARLADAGVHARLRSAYKPLLHALLEEVELSGLTGVTVRLPTHPMAQASRFRLEAYPLAGLLRGVPLAFLPGTEALHHGLTLEHGARRTELRVFAPNRERRTPHGEAVLSPCGWLRVQQGGRVLQDGPLDTEYEQAYAAIMATLEAQPWRARCGDAGRDLDGCGDAGREAGAPCFEALQLDVQTGGIEHRLSCGDECVSTREALHEDLYFSTLELFQHRARRPAGFRGLQPGQIVPDIRAGAGPTRVRVSLRAGDGAAERADGPQVLAEAERPLDPAQIRDELLALGGAPFAATSHQGRLVAGALFAGAGPGLVVSAGQHANETSGPVGALRAGAVLRAQGAAFALIPLENPDGYALHGTLRRANPRHMHHAARYTALGDDLEHRELGPPHERAARLEAFARTDVRLHVTLHGYPAHEWTRPHTGYLPRGFEPWTIPKGFFLILRHHPGLGAPAEAFVAALASRLAEVPGLRAFNDAQLALWAAHAGAPDVPVIAGIPCLVREQGAQVPPYTLITEYPDETVYGDAFRLAHDVQMAAVLAAAALLHAGALPELG